MANIKSAKKRVLTNDRQRSENRYVKATISTYVKDYRKMLAEGKFEDAQKKLNSTISYIDSACSKGVLHKNNASRKIARLTIAYTRATQSAPVEVKAEVKEEVKAAKAEVNTEEAPAKKVAKKATTKKAEDKPAKSTTKTTAKKTTAKTTKKETK